MPDDPVERVETQPYRLSRLELAYVAIAEYVGSFWWIIAVIPAFGVGALIFGEGLLKVIGMMAILWPISIPARSILTTTKSSRLFVGGCRMVATEDRLEFFGEVPGPSGKPYRMTVPAIQIRDLVERRDLMLVRTTRLGFAPVRPEAFATDEDRNAFRSIVERARQLRQMP